YRTHQPRPPKRVYVREVSFVYSGRRGRRLSGLRRGFVREARSTVHRVVVATTAVAITTVTTRGVVTILVAATCRLSRRVRRSCSTRAIIAPQGIQPFKQQQSCGAIIQQATKLDRHRLFQFLRCRDGDSLASDRFIVVLTTTNIRLLFIKQVRV